MLQARLSHVAFKAADVDATRRLYEDNVGLSSLPGDPARLSLGLGEHVLQLRNVPITWGPGRHGPGNNLFIFFDDPDGVRIELTCEVERVYDNFDYPAERIWSDSSGALNLWGTAPEWRDKFKKQVA
jgi:catechol 2,3-dioxygenase-like lactoylglutathione lyase family enzyme